jgi:hypothetical protein
MARTAVLTAIGHDGKDYLLAGRTTPVGKIKDHFRSLKGLPAHDKYQSITYQESDGIAQIRHFKTTKDQEALEKLFEATNKANAKRMAEVEKNPEKFSPPPVEKLHDIMNPAAPAAEKQ